MFVYMHTHSRMHGRACAVCHTYQTLCLRMLGFLVGAACGGQSSRAQMTHQADPAASKSCKGRCLAAWVIYEHHYLFFMRKADARAAPLLKHA